jgi:hypothetical protein
VLRQHRHRAPDDGAADGRLDRDLGPDYKVDGFRFDLMGHHSKANMLRVRAALDALTLRRDGVDGRRIYLYGEGWNFGEVQNDARFVQATQLNMAGTGSARSTTGTATPCGVAGPSTRTRAAGLRLGPLHRPERRPSPGTEASSGPAPARGRPDPRGADRQPAQLPVHGPDGRDR